jgi:hypothetical protein
MDATARTYVDAIHALPAMQAWLDAAFAESEHLPDSERAP